MFRFGNDDFVPLFATEVLKFALTRSAKVAVQELASLTFLFFLFLMREGGWGWVGGWVREGGQSLKSCLFVMKLEM